MKKLIFMFAVATACMFASCGNSTTSVSECDSIDTMQVDTVDLIAL